MKVTKSYLKEVIKEMLESDEVEPQQTQPKLISYSYKDGPYAAGKVRLDGVEYNVTDYSGINYVVAHWDPRKGGTTIDDEKQKKLVQVLRQGVQDLPDLKRGEKPVEGGKLKEVDGIPMNDPSGEYSGRSGTDFSKSGDDEGMPRVNHIAAKPMPVSTPTKFIYSLENDENREQIAVKILKMAGIQPLPQGRNFGYLMMPMIMDKPEVQTAVSKLINKR